MDWNLIAALSSAIIAASALGLSIWQGLVMRQHNKLSLRPHLTTWFNEWYKDGKFELFIVNNGVGPARIRSFTVYVDSIVIGGIRVEPVKQALESLFGAYNFSSEHSFLGPQYSMSANEKIMIIKIEFHGSSPSRPEMEKLIRRLDIVVEYESVYQDRFVMKLHDEV